MKDEIPYEDLEPHLKDISDWELAVLFFKSEWPNLADRPIYTEPGLWERTDSKDFNRKVEAAKRFIQEYERLMQ